MKTNILAKIVERPLRSAKLFPCRLLSLISSIDWQSQKLKKKKSRLAKL
jgi:hypothetical protein